MPVLRLLPVIVLTAAWPWTDAVGQVQVRLGDSSRATYSELHEALKLGTPQADSVRAILTSRAPGQLWQRMHAAVEGTGDWNSALLALTRLAELRVRAYADSAREMQRRLTTADFAPFPNNPGLKAEDLEPSLQAIALEWRRKVDGDSAVLADILRRIPSKDYNHGDAWVLGRLGAGAVDSVAARFRAADTEEFRVRYLTLLSYFTDPGLIPLLSRVYVAPDSFGIPKRYGIRASDGLLWIGTRKSLQALLDSRAVARRRGVYADSSLARGGYDFLANDSSSVISRTGKWLTAWVATLKKLAYRGSAAAGGTVCVAGSNEVVEKLAFGQRQGTGMAAANVLEVRLVVRHAGDTPQERGDDGTTERGNEGTAERWKEGTSERRNE